MGTNKIVLVAEDRSSIQMVTEKVLTFLNYNIESVKNGRDLMEKIERHSYDVILLDLNMPVMDGMTCVKKIRALTDEKKANVPIIAITGNSENYTMEDFKQAGFDAYLQKPLDFDLLGELVQKYTQIRS